MNLIQQLEQEEIARLTQGKTLPAFAPGDTVIVQVKVKEGNRERLQAYEGVVIAKRNRGLNSSFIVRKISSGEGVERTFQTYSPLVAGIEVKRRGDVRRAKLYYLRQRRASRHASRKSWTTRPPLPKRAAQQQQQERLIAHCVSAFRKRAFGPVFRLRLSCSMRRATHERDEHSLALGGARRHHGATHSALEWGVAAQRRST